MGLPNTELVHEVIKSMIMHKPELARFLSPDGRDDIADLQWLIVRNFPWPIGIELQRLFCGDMRDLNRGRLDQIFKTMERSMQFISFVMVIELFEELKAQRIQLNNSFKKQFQERFTTLSLGNFSWMIRAIGDIFKKNNIDYFMPEMKDLFTKKFYNSLDFWVPERNDIGHYQINLSEGETELKCVEYIDKLSKILTNVAFIVKYDLVTVRQIKVLKPRHKEAKFEHWIDVLNGKKSTTEETFDSYCDSNAVLMMKSYKEPENVLNLSPLILDTRTETFDSKEKEDLTKDIFMYTKYDEKKGKINYLGTEMTQKCDLRTLSNYDVLLEDFKELMQLMGSATVST